MLSLTPITVACGLNFDSLKVSDMALPVFSHIDNAMEVALDPKVSARIRLFVDSKPVEAFLDTNLLIDAACGTGNFQLGSFRRATKIAVMGDFGIDRSGELQERRATLDDARRSVTRDLKDLDLLIWAGTNIAIAEAKQYDVESTELDRCQVDADVTAFVAMLDGQHRYSLIDAQICEYLLSACTVRVFLQQTLSLFKVERKWLTRAIAAFNTLARAATTFFCCVSWERRRWFLQHGAHPPKASRPALVGLFAEACSGSPLAA